MSKSRKIHNIWMVAIFILQFLLPASSAAAPPLQGSDAEARAERLLQQLSPEERVGQLFLITFTGTDISIESQIYNLIASKHIGGVILQSNNDNFLAMPDTIEAAWVLTQDLQSAEWQASQEPISDPISGEMFAPEFVPLFIGISQEGDGYPNNQILDGLTPLPNAMAIGATWDPQLAYQVGEVLGQELSDLGFNLLLGPSLDVLESPRPESLGDLGTRSFGGDPYWVGQMGRAFISGAHQGSQDRLVLVGKHFPGHGGSDRSLEEEIPTVNKSLEQLTRIELPPFFAVTGDALSPDATVDALLLSHIRYQGWQGNIRETTPPLSFAPQAFKDLMALEQFASWRTNGGVIISDKLGSRAVRRFYDPTEQVFNAHFVARDAFLAGNDLLYLGNIQAGDDPDNYTAIVRTLDFFAQKYREDLAFAQRVDASVLRILTLKARLYDDFTLEEVLTPEENLANIGGENQISFEVARQAATLFSPSPLDLDTVLPAPPNLNEQIVFITDTYLAKQCSNCPEKNVLAVDALQQAIMRLYGPEAGGQIARQNLASYSFDDLEELLDFGNYINPLRNEIRRSEWVVFVMLDVHAGRSASTALRRLLSERPDLIQQKKIIVFSLNAPYYLDATDISKLTAYYGLYSKTPQFIDVAARLLFNEITAPGASPVSVPGVGYDLITATSPNPAQTIPLFPELVDGEAGVQSVTPAADALPELHVGDQVFLRTGVILDHNGNPVPDNTPVRFIITNTIEGVTAQRDIFTTSVNGTAQTTLLVETGGTLEIRATSGEPQASSEPLQFEIPLEGGEVIITATSEPTLEPTPEPSPTVPSPDELEPPPRTKTTLGDWILALMITLFVSVLVYQVGAFSGQVRWGIRWALCALLGGLAVNTYLGFELPGSAELLASSDTWGVVMITFLGAFIGWGIGWVWRVLTRNHSNP